VIESNSSLEEVKPAVDQSVAAIYSFFTPSQRSQAIEGQLDPVMRNEPAKEFVLAGRELMQRQNTADLDHALGCFERAIQIEPASALARAYFATTAGTRLHYTFEPALLQKATDQAQRAVELNPDLPEAHRALAGMAFHKGDLHGALAEAYLCIELGGPEVPMLALIGDSLKMLGQPHRAIAWFEKMAEWGRRPADDAWMIGDCWADLGDDERAEANYRRVSELNPELPQGWLGICRLRLLRGDFQGASAILAEHSLQNLEHTYTKQMAAQIAFFARDFFEAQKMYSQLAATDTVGGGTFYGAVSYASVVGFLRIRNSDEQGGRQILVAALTAEHEALHEAPHHPEVLYRVAAIESSLGEVEAAVGHLREASKYGWLDFRSLAIDPRFDRLRETALFQEILRVIETEVTRLRLAAVVEDQKHKSERPR
jgi:tetratricopeptide (TPR) repeat protein